MCTKVLSVEDGSMKNRDKKCLNPHHNTKFSAKLRRKTKPFQKVSALFSFSGQYLAIIHILNRKKSIFFYNQSHFDLLLLETDHIQII